VRRVRVIPTLLLDSSGAIVKTVNFKKRTYIGDPINAVKIFNAKGADELVLLDIDATRLHRPPNINLLENIVSEAFMPVAYGGGIRTVEEISSIFSCGVEKVILSSVAINSTSIISEAAAKFGAQSIVVCIDVGTSFFGKKRVFVNGAKTNTGREPVATAIEMVYAGAGELLINSIERDGTYKGYDFKVLSAIAEAVAVPVVASGGAAGLEDMVRAVAESHCSAVAAGSMFLYKGPEKGILVQYPPEEKMQRELYEKVEAISAGEKFWK